jgi:hypothetical protein
MKSFLANPFFRRALCGIAFCFCSLLPGSIFAQGASPLELGRRIVPDVLGIVVGPNFNYASGTFDTGCPCTFTGGFGIGPVIGVMYEKNLLSPSPQWRLGTLNLGARLLYEQRNIATAFLEYERVQAESQTQRGQFFTVPVLFRHLAEGSFSMFTLTPYLSWNPFTQAQGFLQGVYFQVGIQGGFVIDSRIRHTKFVEQPTVRLPNGEVTSVGIVIDSLRNTSDRRVVEDGPFARVNQLQLGLNLGAGADIPLGREGGRFRFSPFVQYVFPLTNMSEAGQNFRIGSLQVLLGLKMNLQDVSN